MDTLSKVEREDIKCKLCIEVDKTETFIHIHFYRKKLKGGPVDKYDYPINQSKYGDIKRMAREGICSEKKLISIGQNLRDLFPPEIRKLLDDFDTDAEKVEPSGSRFILIIETHLRELSIPWELTLTKDRTPWYRRYLVSRKVSELGKERERSSKIRKSILIITKPFYEKKLKERLRKCVQNEEEYEALEEEFNEFISGFDELKSFVCRLEHEKGFKVTLHQYPIIFADLEDDLVGVSKEKFDLILYVGGYHYEEEWEKGGLAIEDNSRPESPVLPVHPTIINTGKHVEAAIFLDTCGKNLEMLKPSGVQEKELEISKESKLVQKLTEKYIISGKASSFIGITQPVDGIVGTKFAYTFLKTLLEEELSIGDAMYDARNKILEDFSENERKRIQSCSYIVVGASTEAIYNSFVRSWDRIRLMWSDLVLPYFNPFYKEVYPSGAKNIMLDRFPDFEYLITEFEKRIKDSTEPLLVDLPILYAAKAIAQNKGSAHDLVIIGVLFRLDPKEGDSSLYITGDSQKIEQAEHLYFHDYFSSVTAMTQVLLWSLDPDLHCKFSQARCRTRMPYKNIKENLIDEIEAKELQPKLRLLAGLARFEFEEELQQKYAYVKNKILQPKINVYKKFKESLSGNKELNKYMLKTELPGSVLVARRKDVEQNRSLYTEVLSRWYLWTTEKFRERNPELLGKQTIAFELTEADKKELINFTKLILSPPFNGLVFGKDLGFKELTGDCFLPISTRFIREIKPEEEQKIQEIEKEQKTAIDKVEKKLNAMIEEVNKERKKFSDGKRTQLDEGTIRPKVFKEVIRNDDETCDKKIAQYNSLKEKWKSIIKSTEDVNKLKEVQGQIEKGEILLDEHSG